MGQKVLAMVVEVLQVLGLLVVMLSTAKLFGALAQRIGQPVMLGELVAGVVLGLSVLGLVDPQTDVLHLFAEFGVIILLFQIGLETDLRQLLQVGGAATVVALVGMALPFAFGYAVCWGLRFDPLVAIVVGATLTATSVGITGRVLVDLNRLHEPESHIILGAAVIDDQTLRSSSQPLQAWECMRASLETELSPEFVDTEVPIVPLPLQ